MELTVYRQSSKTRPDGTVVYKGEDARPYVDGQIFFVADGLGGAAAIRHQKIKPELFDEDQLLDTLFSGVYDDYGNETFAAYVKESFFELFAVKDCYTDNINNIKKSGYFASRIVAAIILHEMLYNGAYSAESIFSTLAARGSEAERAAYLGTLGRYFRDLIQGKIRQIARNANLVYESAYSGLALLGSTICATVYLEHEDHVEALYLTAGDSRPYVWTEGDGLCQVLPDQEGKDGGMTNYIKANEDATFDIRCDYFRFDKPCILFNATDGCFDSGRFISQLAFEKLIAESAIASDSVEKMGEYLTAFFVENGRHDDSSTLAMKMFGYDTFASLQASLARRLQVLQNLYFGRMSDLLDADYEAAFGESDRALAGQLASLKEKFAAEAGVTAYCTREIRAGKYAPYTERIREVDGKIAAERQRIGAARQAISDSIASYYSKFRPYLNRQDNWFDANGYDRVESAERKWRETADDYTAFIQQLKNEFRDHSASLSAAMEAICGVGVPTSFDDFRDIPLQTPAGSGKTMDAILDFIGGLRSQKSDYVRRLMAQRQDYLLKNVKLAEKHPEDVARVTSMIVSGELAVASLPIPDAEKAKMTNALNAIAAASDAIGVMETADKERITETSCREYWESHYAEIIPAVVSDPAFAIREDLANEAKTMLAGLEAEHEGIREKRDLQKTLFGQYEKGYDKYIGGTENDDPRI